MARRDHRHERNARMGRHKIIGTLTSNQKEMLARRGYDPKNYEFVKESYGSLYVRDKRTGKIKVIYKQN